MLSVPTTSVSRKNSQFNKFIDSESPVTQDSASMSSVTDEYDFKNNDISSSAQTSTASPIRNNNNNNNNNNTNTNNSREPKFSSFSFYSGPPIDVRNKSNNNNNNNTNNLKNENHHAFAFRKSLIISPSFNSISSNHDANEENYSMNNQISNNNTNDKIKKNYNKDFQIVSTLDDPLEEPTKNIGMVISPSIRALSDILTNKIKTSSNSNLINVNTFNNNNDNNNHLTVLEGNEEDDIDIDIDIDIDVDDNDNSTILFETNYLKPKQQTSLIDGIYSLKSTNISTFPKTSSNDTLILNILPNDQPDLIDLNSPVITTTNFQSIKPIQNLNSNSNANSNPNYSDIYESFAPPQIQNNNANNNNNNNNTINSKKSPFVNKTSNRFSIMSDSINLNEFDSPALNFNEPVEIFNFINPSISFSKLSIADSFQEFGYDNDINDDNDEFSFVPSRAGTLINNNNSNNNNNNNVITTTINNNNNNKVENIISTPISFVQKHKTRDSIRIVKDEDDKSPFINEFLKSPNLYFSNNSTPILNTTTDFYNDNITPKLNSVTNLSPPLNGDNNTPNTGLFNSPSLLNRSPIRNTSPTFEKIKNSPTQQIKKKFINLSPPKSPKILSSPKQTKPVKAAKPIKKMEPAKPKTKLTFKSLFSKSTDNFHLSNEKKNKSPLVSQTEKFNRPKSFSFDNLGVNNDTGNNNTSNNNNQKTKEERKEKSKSLLSGWKRKSFGFTNNNHLKSQSVASLPVLNQSVKHTTPPSPHKHSKSTTELFNKKLPDLPPPPPQSQPISQIPLTTRTIDSNSQSLLQTYGFDNESPHLKQSPIVSKSPNLANKSIVNANASQNWNRNPTIKKSESRQTFETTESPVDLPEPQSAEFDNITPQIFPAKTFQLDSPIYYNKVEENKPNEKIHDFINTSSTYDTTNENENEHKNLNDDVIMDNDLKFFKPPQALGIITKPPSTPTGIITNQSNLNNLSQTPPSASSPAFSVVESFISSPNKYHIGDDMFPKKLGINDIESIVSLERSRSMKSIRSANNNSLANKNSILRMIHDQNDDFTEMRMPNGMVIVKSPMLDQNSLWSKPSRKSSILKRSINGSVSPNVSEKPNEFIPNDNIDNRIGDDGDDDGDDDQDFNNFIDMINFDTDGLDNQFDTNFDIDTSLHVNISPIRNNQIIRDSSVPDFLGIETSYGSMKFDDELSFIEDPSNQLYSNKLPSESIENIIQEEENLHKDSKNYITQSLHNENYQYYSPQNEYNSQLSPLQGLKGPSFNSSLKPETKSAIIGSLSKQPPVNSFMPSDSENSISYIVQGYQESTKSQNNSSFDNYNEYANYYDNKSPVQTSPINSKYSLNNPFTDYTQNYDDDDDDDNADEQHYDEYIDKNEIQIDDSKANKRKSLSFINKLGRNDYGHFSTSSVPTTTSTIKQEDKPKTLNRRRNRTSVSLGSMFDSLIPHKEETQKLSVKFSSRILLYDTYNEDEYDRKPDSATCNTLTPQIAMEIKNELNQLKAEMPVHEDSRCYTHFF